MFGGSFNQAPAGGDQSKRRSRFAVARRMIGTTREGKRMKRREFLKVGGVGLAASTVAAPAIAQSMPDIKWRLTASWPKSLDTLYGGCEYFFKNGAESTPKKIQIQPLPPRGNVPGPPGVDAPSPRPPRMGDTPPYFFLGKKPAPPLRTAPP